METQRIRPYGDVGPIFPGVIARVEEYDQNGERTANYHEATLGQARFVGVYDDCADWIKARK